MASGDFPRPPTVQRRDPAAEAAFNRLSPYQQEIIEALEKSRDRPLTEPEIHLSLEQAKALGEI